MRVSEWMISTTAHTDFVGYLHLRPRRCRAAFIQKRRGFKGARNVFVTRMTFNRRLNLIGADL